MRVEIDLNHNISEAYAVIHTDQISEEVKMITEMIEKTKHTSMASEVILVKEDEKFIVLNPDEIFMVRLEDGHNIIYGEKTSYQSTKRLYEMEERLGSDFMRISKTTIINLKKIESVEPSFSGMMYLKLKNNCKDYISRKYLPEFKKYLGL